MLLFEYTDRVKNCVIGTNRVNSGINTLNFPLLDHFVPETQK